MSSYALDYPIAAQAPANARVSFIRRTYAHLGGAILAFVGLEAILLQLVDAKMIMGMLGHGWLVVLIAFIAVSWLANYWAQSNASPALQYAGLGLYVVAEAVIFVPILYIADRAYPGVIGQAGIMTLAVFAGLTIGVFVTGKDYSFLGPVLCLATFLMLGFALVGYFMGFSMGIVYCGAGVALASGYILYDTSNVMLHYRTDQHVAASLALFASVALLFWYILRIFMATRD